MKRYTIPLFLYSCCRFGLFGSNTKDYHDDDNQKYIITECWNLGFFTYEQLWIDPSIYAGPCCYKKTNLYIRPLQVFHNNKHIYTDPIIKYIARQSDYRSRVDETPPSIDQKRKLDEA